MSTMIAPGAPGKPLDLASPRAKAGSAVGKGRPEGGFRKVLKSESVPSNTAAIALLAPADKKYAHRIGTSIASVSQRKPVTLKQKKLLKPKPHKEALPAPSEVPQLIADRRVKPTTVGDIVARKKTAVPTPKAAATPLAQLPRLSVPVKLDAPEDVSLSSPKKTQEAHLASEESRTLIVSRRFSPVLVPKEAGADKNRVATKATAPSAVGNTAAVGKAASPPLIPVELAPPDNKLRELSGLKPMPTTFGAEPLSKASATTVQGWQVHPVSIRGQVDLHATRWKVSPPGRLHATIELGLSNSTKGWTVQIAASHGETSWLTGAVANVTQLGQNFAKHGWNLSEVSLWNTSAGNPMGNNPSYSAFGQSGQGASRQMDRGFASGIGPTVGKETLRLSESSQGVDYTA
ncbi:MAG: hypothetical protein C7B46_08695 [Sulfobacillus benefaciens]|uniref:Uncharacterized protein n=1 Tax=Sulfobacillus benefaciens TaxID=453960 RepID=A0A2T2XGT9_9FIRM|nr:MAG: hypothetical protein C7B46_08695 [Sulfobacillus benefaciens]